jgi:hypothetical protein
MRCAAIRTRQLARDMLIFWKRVDKEQVFFLPLRSAEAYFDFSHSDFSVLFIICIEFNIYSLFISSCIYLVSLVQFCT